MFEEVFVIITNDFTNTVLMFLIVLLSVAILDLT